SARISLQRPQQELFITCLLLITSATMRGSCTSSRATFSSSRTPQMIPEYKLYHGAVLADIVDRCDGAVAIRECIDAGRLLNYVLDDRIGLQIKYSTARLGPWSFSFSSRHVAQLRSLVK